MKSRINTTRNPLIHGYFAIDYEVVWVIIKNELTDLK